MKALPRNWTHRWPSPLKMINADPRYFCVIGLSLPDVRRKWMTIISHEAVHAGFCYAKRVTRSPWAEKFDFDEEQIAYPSGNIASGINRQLYRRKLYG